MTTRPHLRTSSRQVVGLVSLALFLVLAAVFLNADFTTPQGFSDVGSITAAIGYALFNLDAEVVPAGTEGFLVAFEIIDVVLVAALTAAIMLARRQEGGHVVTALADGGRRVLDDGGRTGPQHGTADGGDGAAGGDAASSEGGKASAGGGGEASAGGGGEAALESEGGS